MLSSKKTTNILSSSILISALVFFLIAIFTRGEIINKVFLYDANDTFMDHFNNTYRCFAERPYDFNVVYPPLSTLIYSGFAKIIPRELFLSDWFSYTGGRDIRCNQTGILEVFFMICTSTLIIINAFNFNREARERTILSATIIFSMPLMYAIERGNMVILSVAFFMMFFTLRSHENKVLKEIGLISLSISAALKIYPAIFVLILLKEKKYYEMIRTILYGVCLFLIPFMFFGGLKTVFDLINNIIYTSNVSSNFGYGMKIGFKNLLAIAYEVIFGRKLVNGLITLLNYLFVVQLVICFVITKEKWKEYALLGFICINLIPTPYIYCLLFLLPALNIYINMNHERSLRNITYLILFILLFMYFPIPLVSIFKELNASVKGFELYADSFIKCLSINVFGGLLMIDVLSNKLKKIIVKKSG